MSARGTVLQPSFARPASHVAIRHAENYEHDLTSLLFETLREFRLPVRGKTVFLKPNLVALDPHRTINTHPAVVAAAREGFLRLGAREVRVGDGPALERDTEAILESVGLRDHLGSLQGVFTDLNTDEVHRVRFSTRVSSLRELYLPQSVLQADFIVSLPKLKTHHWSGVTLSLKNMFGIVPGACYGWPKNLLHWVGISSAILDLNAAVRPDFAIVDGIVGMEGNGPIQGKPKPCGVVVCGEDPVAVDATCARIMALRPERIDYLAKASYWLGHLREDKILQIGETIARVRTPFQVLERFQELRARMNCPSGSGIA